MADETDRGLRNLVMYQVYVRSYSRKGSFKALEADLDRIQALGVDLIHLLPVHPIGKQNRKGSLGSPYAAADYRGINGEWGTAEDFYSLVGAIRRRGMKCIMDIVYNHCALDSLLAKEHPEWFYRKADGGMGSRIGDWWDVADLDYSNPQSGLWEYQIETLKIWAKIADGFRCDVAPLVPLGFWLRAREETARINPDCLWIAESVEPSFIVENRARGLACHSDSELYRAFDVCYDYDIFGAFKKYLAGSIDLASYAEKINAQEYLYPDNYVKLRNLENHDQERAKSLIPDEKALRNWTAFNYFQKGLTLVYAGEEWENEDRPSLFEKETLNRDTGADLSPLMRALYGIKKDPALTDSAYEVKTADSAEPAGFAEPAESADLSDILMGIHRPKAPHRAGLSPLAGIFSLKGQNGVIRPGKLFEEPIPDGSYTNLIDNSTFRIEKGRLELQGEPVIFKLPPQPT